MQEKESVEAAEAATTTTLKPPMVSPSKITTEYSHPKVASVLSVVEERAKDISQLTITTRTGMYGGFSAPAAIVALLNLWIEELTWGERTDTSEETVSESENSSEGK